MISQIFLQIQSELNIPNHIDEEYKKRWQESERKYEMMKKENTNEINALVAEIERKDNMIAELKKDAEKKKELYEWDKKYNWDRYHETSEKLEVAEKTIARMKKGLFSYFEVCFEDWREARLKKKHIKKEVKERQKRYAELERKWEREKKQKEKEKYKR